MPSLDRRPGGKYEKLDSCWCRTCQAKALLENLTVFPKPFCRPSAKKSVTFNTIKTFHPMAIHRSRERPTGMLYTRRGAEAMHYCAYNFYAVLELERKDCS